MFMFMVFLIGCKSKENVTGNTIVETKSTTTIKEVVKENLIELKTEEFFKCNKDDDCSMVKKDCSSCLAGKLDSTSINKKYSEEWDRRLNCGEFKPEKCIAKETLSTKCIDNSCWVV